MNDGMVDPSDAHRPRDSLVPLDEKSPVAYFHFLDQACRFNRLSRLATSDPSAADLQAPLLMAKAFTTAASVNL
jgi:hypothetical protein